MPSDDDETMVFVFIYSQKIFLTFVFFKVQLHIIRRSPQGIKGQQILTTSMVFHPRFQIRRADFVG